MKPDIRNDGRIVKISIYGNGLIAGGLVFGTHHVLVVLKTDSDHFILLEVEKCGNGKININKGIAATLSGVLAKRHNMEAKTTFWRSAEVKKISPSVIQEIINQYHGSDYHALESSCRTFVDAICCKCGTDIRCVMSNEWWAFW